MSATLELPFQIGAAMWLPVTTGKRVEIVCPVCAGHRAITVTLGDSEQVRVTCEACALGCDGPRGYVAEHRYEPGATKVTILAVESMRDGKWRVSTDDGTSHDFDQLRTTESDALAVSAERCAECWERVMESHCRKREVGNVGWTVRYHRQQIAELKKKMAWHEAKVQAAK